jgi:hypothetical protein
MGRQDHAAASGVYGGGGGVAQGRLVAARPWSGKECGLAEVGGRDKITPLRAASTVETAVWRRGGS